jgi:hypothetical protein
VAQHGGDLLSVITRHAIRRGSFTSVKDPVAAIENSIDRIDRPAGAGTTTVP